MLWLNDFSADVDSSSMDELKDWKSDVYKILALILTVFSIVTNLVIVFTVVRIRYFLSAMQWFLVNIAISDIFVAVFIIPGYIYRQYLTYPELDSRSDIVCKMLNSFAFCWLGFYSQTCILVIIGIERYISQVQLISRQWIQNNLKTIIILSWVFGLVVQIPDIVAIGYSKDLGVCLYIWPQEVQTIWALVRITICDLVPLVTMVVLYANVIHKLWFQKCIKIIETSRIAIRLSRKRVTKVAISISIVNGVCLILNMVIYLITKYGHIAPRHLFIVQFISHFSLLINASIKSLLYCFQSRHFRRSFFATMKCLSGKRQNSVGSCEGVTSNTDFPRNSVFYKAPVNAKYELKVNELPSCQDPCEKKPSTICRKKTSVMPDTSREVPGKIAYKEPFYAEGHDNLVRYGGIWLGTNNEWPEIQLPRSAVANNYNKRISSATAMKLTNQMKGAWGSLEHVESPSIKIHHEIQSSKAKKYKKNIEP